MAANFNLTNYNDCTTVLNMTTWPTGVVAGPLKTSDHPGCTATLDGGVAVTSLTLIPGSASGKAAGSFWVSLWLEGTAETLRAFYANSNTNKALTSSGVSVIQLHRDEKGGTDEYGNPYALWGLRRIITFTGVTLVKVDATLDGNRETQSCDCLFSFESGIDTPYMANGTDKYVPIPLTQAAPAA